VPGCAFLNGWTDVELGGDPPVCLKNNEIVASIHLSVTDTGVPESLSGSNISLTDQERIHAGQAVHQIVLVG
jgi:hypothetical protein